METKLCYQLVITLTKFVISKVFFFNQNTRNSKIFLLAMKKKKPFKRARDGSLTVQLLRHDAYCPIKLMSYKC